MLLRPEQAERCQELLSCAASRSLDRKMIVMNFQMKVNCLVVNLLKQICNMLHSDVNEPIDSVTETNGDYM